MVAAMACWRDPVGLAALSPSEAAAYPLHAGMGRGASRAPCCKGRDAAQRRHDPLPRASRPAPLMAWVGALTEYPSKAALAEAFLCTAAYKRTPNPSVSLGLRPVTLVVLLLEKKRFSGPPGS